MECTPTTNVPWPATRCALGFGMSIGFCPSVPCLGLFPGMLALYFVNVYWWRWTFPRIVEPTP